MIELSMTLSPAIRCTVFDSVGLVIFGRIPPKIFKTIIGRCDDQIPPHNSDMDFAEADMNRTRPYRDSAVFESFFNMIRTFIGGIPFKIRYWFHSVCMNIITKILKSK
jgi:hypothetical protein